MAIQDGQLTEADDVMNALGSNFLDFTQLLFNAAYIGFDSDLFNTGVPNTKNVFYSVFASDDADVNYGFVYDAGNDIYQLPDLSSITEYVIVEATSLSAPWTSNDCLTIQFAAGKWLVYCTAGNAEVKRAQIHKSLWYGTDGTDALMDDFTSVTAVKSIDARDTDKRATLSLLGSCTGATSTQWTGTFNDTSTNNDCSVWSYLTNTTLGAQGGTSTIRAEFAAGNTINTIGIGGNSTATSDEMGTDRSADELTNPADIQLEYSADYTGTSAAFARAVILHEGTISWAETGTPRTHSEKDYTTDDSIPVMTLADTLVNEGVGVTNTLIFQDTASASVTNAIASINSTIDATSSEQISISADGGSNYTDVDNGEVARPTPGTALWRKIVITRADLSKQDIVTEQAVKYNYY